ncbi:hypothetical protein K8R66_01440, partial [bacterium]|nr:hypothetical protein [bacterium]
FMSLAIANKAGQLAGEGSRNIMLMRSGDQNKIDRSIRLLKQAIALDSNNINANYNLRYLLKNEDGFKNSELSKRLDQNIKNAERLKINNDNIKEKSRIDNNKYSDKIENKIKTDFSKLDIEDDELNKNIKFLDDIKITNEEYSEEIKKEFKNLSQYMIDNDVITRRTIPGVHSVYSGFSSGEIGKYSMEFNDKNKDKKINTKRERIGIEYRDKDNTRYHIGYSTRSGFSGYATNKDILPQGFRVINKKVLLDKYFLYISGKQESVAFRELTEQEIKEVMEDVQLGIDDSRGEIELNMKNKTEFIKIIEDLNYIKDRFKGLNENYEFIIEEERGHKKDIKGLKYIDENGNNIIIENGYIGFNAIACSDSEQEGFFKKDTSDLYWNHGINVDVYNIDLKKGEDVYIKKLKADEVKEIIDMIKKSTPIEIKDRVQIEKNMLKEYSEIGKNVGKLFQEIAKKGIFSKNKYDKVSGNIGKFEVRASNYTQNSYTDCVIKLGSTVFFQDYFGNEISEVKVKNNKSAELFGYKKITIGEFRRKYKYQPLAKRKSEGQKDNVWQDNDSIYIKEIYTKEKHKDDSSLDGVKRLIKDLKKEINNN